MKKNKKVKNKKIGRNIALILLIFFVIILGILSIIFFNNATDPSGIATEEDPITKLTLMGEQLYSEYYYKIISEDKTEEEMKEYLKKYEEIGLKIDLNEMAKYNDEYNQYIESFVATHKKCKKEETMVIIYPKDPYTNKDFDSELSMQCIIKTKK